MLTTLRVTVQCVRSSIIFFRSVSLAPSGRVSDGHNLSSFLDSIGSRVIRLVFCTQAFATEFEAHPLLAVVSGRS
jgi:hypothetical protein